MKKLLSVVLIAILLFSVLTLTSCNSSYNKLSKLEKKVFDILLLQIENKFTNPSSVRVLDIYKIGELDDGNVYASIELQGKNSFGGTITQHYYLISEATGEYRFVETSKYSADFFNAKVNGDKNFPVYEYLFEDAPSDITPANDIEKKFNNALTEYWDKKGISS